MQKVNRNDPSPRYLQAKAILKETILQGIVRVGDRLPGERELAQSLGVSQMTANRAIQALVEERFLRREVGVGTFVVATEPQLVEPRSRISVILFSELRLDFVERDIYFGPLLRGMTFEGARRNCDFTFATAVEQGSLMTLFQKADPRRDRFVLVSPPNTRLAEIEAVSTLGIPFVVVGAHWENRPAVPCVDCDNRGGAHAAVEHLLDRGHRDIAVFCTWMDAANSVDRVEGYRSALRRRGVAVKPEHCVEVPAEEIHTDAFVQRIRRLFSQDVKTRPTALFAAGYILALEARRVLGTLGYRVPEDVSLIGFDDTASAAFLDPPLTTVRQPLLAMGAASVEEVIRGGDTRVKLFPAELVVRRSTASTLGLRDSWARVLYQASP